MTDVTDFLVGGCEVFRDFADRLTQVARSDVTVLVEGESGTGKNLAARALHQLSDRADGPLVEVPLAALSATLVDAELFGHEEGAYTGAHRARTGRIRRADQGTLVLDGVESLPSEQQVKLLRVLQERVIEPLGAEMPVPIDVRVVATATLDLEAEVRAGRFREDLYYRLAVVKLDVPPLRARSEDLPRLVEALSADVARRTGAPRRSFSDEALARLAAHPWPGNVRELENALERVHALVAGGGKVEVDELSFLDESVSGAAERIAEDVLAHGLTLDELARAVLGRALAEQRGNVSAAARRVGLTRRAFEYRMAKPASSPEDSASPEDSPSNGGERPTEES